MPSEQPPVDVPIRDSEGKLLLSYRCTTDKPSLLDLPLELRALVYSYIFDDAVIEIRCSSPGNERRDHWFTSDRNLLSHKFTSTTSIRPHIWRLRSQILGTCRQIRAEILSFNCYHLHLNNLGASHYHGVHKHLTPFLWSHITTISATHWKWLRDVQNDLELPLLEKNLNNSPYKTTLDTQMSDKFNVLYALPYLCYRNVEDIQAVRDGMRDGDIFTRFTSSLSEAIALSKSSSSKQSDRVFFSVRIRVVILPMLFDMTEWSRGGHVQVSWPALYPQLVLLAKWNSETSGEIVERHWRDDAKTGHNWECLSINKDKCSCLESTYCSTTLDNEQYCEDWYGNVTGPPAWREPRGIEDEIYSEGYCLFEN